MLNGLKSLIILSALTSIVFFGNTAAAAGASRVAITGPSQDIIVGDALTVNFWISGNELTNVTFHMQYDDSKLSCSASSFSGSGQYPITVSASCGGGSAVITRFVTPGTLVSGNQFFVALNFTTKATGAANVSVVKAIVPKNNVDDWDGITASRTFNVVAAPQPAPQPSPAPAPAPVQPSGRSEAPSSPDSDQNQPEQEQDTVSDEAADEVSQSEVLPYGVTTDSGSDADTNNAEYGMVLSDSKRSKVLISSGVLAAIAGVAIAVWMKVKAKPEPAPVVYTAKPKAKAKKKPARKTASTKKTTAKTKKTTKKSAKK